MPALPSQLQGMFGAGLFLAEAKAVLFGSARASQVQIEAVADPVFRDLQR